MDGIQTLIGAAQHVSKDQETQTQQVVSKGQANKNFWDGIMFGITLAGLLHTMTHRTRKVTHEETLEETHEETLEETHEETLEETHEENSLRDDRDYRRDDRDYRRDDRRDYRDDRRDYRRDDRRDYRDDRRDYRIDSREKN